MPEYNILEAAGLSQLKIRDGMRIVDEETRKVSRMLGFDYYDGSRKYGFGGYYYDGRWETVAKIIKERYKLNKDSKVLIDRDEKGFLVFDLKKLIPGIIVYGIHPSEYPVNHAMEGYGRWDLMNGIEKYKDPNLIEQEAINEIMPFLLKADNLNLPFKDKYFDTFISIHNVCNYEEHECRKAVKELIRVSKNNGKNSYIQIDSWKNESEMRSLMDWVLICRTFLDSNGWKRLFEEEGFEGDWGFVRFDKENSNKTAVILGASGLIGSYLFEDFKRNGYKVIGTYNKHRSNNLIYFDITKNSLNDLDIEKIDYLIICSAIAKIDECMANLENSRNINVNHMKRIIKEAIDKKIKLVFISGAIVFDGNGNYKEGDFRNPVNEYGRQKKEIEDFIVENADDYLLIRLGKIFGLRKNESIFSGWIEKIQNSEKILCNVDEELSLTSADDVAKAIEILLKNNKKGIYHVDSMEHKKRIEFAKEFFKHLNIENSNLRECSEKDFNFLEKRAKNQTLDSTKFKTETGFEFTRINDLFDKIIENHFS